MVSIQHITLVVLFMASHLFAPKCRIFTEITGYCVPGDLARGQCYRWFGEKQTENNYDWSPLSTIQSPVEFVVYRQGMVCSSYAIYDGLSMPDSPDGAILRIIVLFEHEDDLYALCEKISKYARREVLDLNTRMNILKNRDLRSNFVAIKLDPQCRQNPTLAPAILAMFFQNLDENQDYET